MNAAVATPTEARQTTSEPAPRARIDLRLDDLLSLGLGELTALYCAAKVPDLGAIRGDLRGRMLATTVLSGRAARLVRGWASSGAFPWRGKSFMPRAGGAGEGINRVVSDRLKLFRFETSIGRSRAGDFDAVELDYDLPENPFFIRAIKDEIREIAPGLYLGQAYLKLPSATRLVLFFALSS
jgi:hypothetical protein